MPAAGVVTDCTTSPYADFNAPDLMSASTWRCMYPGVPPGLGIIRNLNVSGAACFTRFQLDITRQADIFTGGPP